MWRFIFALLGQHSCPESSPHGVERQWWRFVLWLLRKDYFKALGHLHLTWDALIAKERVQPSKATLKALKAGSELRKRQHET